MVFKFTKMQLNGVKCQLFLIIYYYHGYIFFRVYIVYLAMLKYRYILLLN